MSPTAYAVSSPKSPPPPPNPPIDLCFCDDSDPEGSTHDRVIVDDPSGSQCPSMEIIELLDDSSDQESHHSPSAPNHSPAMMPDAPLSNHIDEANDDPPDGDETEEAGHEPPDEMELDGEEGSDSERQSNANSSEKKLADH